jgi:hypothetical protein
LLSSDCIVNYYKAPPFGQDMDDRRSEHYYKEDESGAVFRTIPEGKVPFGDGDAAGEVQVDDAGWRRAILAQVDVLLALSLLQAQVQLLAVVLVLHWAARHAEQSTAPEDAVSEASADVNALVHLSEDLEVGSLADVEPHCRHLVQPTRREHRVVLQLLHRCLRLQQLRRLLPRQPHLLPRQPHLLPRQPPLLPLPALLLLVLPPALVLVVLVGVVGGGDLEDGVDEEVEVGLLVADAQVEVLVDLVEGLGVDAFGEMGVLLGPVFEDGPEGGADANRLLHEFLAAVVEEELEAVGDEHEVEDEALVLGVVAGDADHVPHHLRVLRDEAIADVPVGLPDHVGEEDALDLVEEEDLGDGLEHFVDGVLEGDGAAAGH